MKDDCLFTFPNTRAAILAERVLIDNGFSASVMPLPVVIAKGCGISLRVPGEQWERAARALDAGGVAAFSVFAIHFDGDGTSSNAKTAEYRMIGKRG